MPWPLPDSPPQSEVNYRSLFEDSRDAFYISTPDGRFVDVNPATIELFGYSRAELMGMNVIKLYLDPGDRKRFRETVERDGYVKDFEVRLRTKDGAVLHCLITCTVRHTAAGAVGGYQGIIRDITARRDLEGMILRAATAERRRVGRELHDGLGQHLTGLAMSCRALAAQLTARSDPDASHASTIEHLANEAVSLTRRLAAGLDPVAVEQAGLAAALEELASDATELYGIPCAVAADPVSFENAAIATQLHYIAREALTNAAIHATPKTIEIALTEDDGGVTLVVADDGSGVPEAGFAAGHGLDNMKYRARLIHAGLVIEPRAGGGTAVRCSLPARGHREPETVAER